MSLTPSVKDKARRLIETLPGDPSWEDLMYRIYVRQAVEAGFATLRKAAQSHMKRSAVDSRPNSRERGKHRFVRSQPLSPNFRQMLQTPDVLIEPRLNRGAVGELPALKVNPVEPIHARKKDVGAVEGGD